MRVLTRPEFLEFLGSHGAAEWSPNPYLDEQEPINRAAFALPSEAGRRIYLCQFFDRLFGFTECLMYATDTLWLKEFGLQPVFDAYLRQLGASPPEKGANAYHFSAAEMQACRDLLTIAVLGGWDVYTFAPEKRTIVFFSHDEFIDVFTVSAPELDAIADRLAEFKMEPFRAKK